jgi:hypothetical protein
MPGAHAGSRSPIRSRSRKSFRSQKGAALAYVIALLAIFGILVGYTWRFIRFNDKLVSLDRWDTQARLLSLSGLDYALAKIGPPGPKQNLGYAAEDLIYRLDDSDLIFDLTVRSHGAFARARSKGKTRLPDRGRVRVESALLGQALDLGKLPAIGRMNHEGNMVLAGSAQVTGPVLLWRGDVRKATDYNVRWKGGAGHTGPVWDSTANAWEKVRPDFRRAQAWMNAQALMLASGQSGEDPDYDSGTVKDVRLSDSGLLADTVLHDSRILAAGILRVGTGARLRDCKLLSAHVVIEAGAKLERCLVYAGRNLDVKGGDIGGGQFLAGDTVRISSDSPLADYPLFYAQGRMVDRGKPDSILVGAMVLEKARGQGIFLAAFPERPVYDQEIRLVVKPGVRLSGLIFCSGYTQMEGDLQGSLICHNLKFQYKGTIWLGHLKDAHLSAAMGSKVIPAPLLFPGFPPVAFGAKGP